MTATPVQLPLGVRWLRAPDFASFVLDLNTEAVATLMAAATTVTPPLMLYGIAGAGKTHLLQAAARLAHKQHRRAAYLPLRHDVEALGGYETLDFVCVDQCEAVAGAPALAIGLARLMDAVTARGGSLVLASRHRPQILKDAAPADLCTRLAACNVHILRPLSDVGLRDALQRQAHARGLALEVGVADYLIHRLPRDMGTLMAALDELDRASLSAQRRLTIPFVQQCLAQRPVAPAPTSARTGSG